MELEGRPRDLGDALRLGLIVAKLFRDYLASPGEVQETDFEALQDAKSILQSSWKYVSSPQAKSKIRKLAKKYPVAVANCGISGTCWCDVASQVIESCLHAATNDDGSRPPDVDHEWLKITVDKELGIAPQREIGTKLVSQAKLAEAAVLAWFTEKPDSDPTAQEVGETVGILDSRIIRKTKNWKRIQAGKMRKATSIGDGDLADTDEALEDLVGKQEKGRNRGTMKKSR